MIDNRNTLRSALKTFPAEFGIRVQNSTSLDIKYVYWKLLGIRIIADQTRPYCWNIDACHVDEKTLSGDQSQEYSRNK